MLDRGVEESLNFGEINDLVEFALDFTLAHTQDSSVEVDVFATGELVIRGDATNPAKVVLEDLEYTSREALRVVWTDEEVIIESTEAGRTRTSVVNRQTTGS